MSPSSTDLSPGDAPDPIDRLFLLVLKARLHGGVLDDAAQVLGSGTIDWDACTARARSQRLEPLLHASLAGKGLLPPAVEERWRRAHLANGVRNALLERELATALALLDGQALDPMRSPILLKGAALAQTAYGDWSLRPMDDIDLLVHPAGVTTAVRALAAGGYEATTQEVRSGITAEFENEVALRRPGHGAFMLELHWSLLDSPHHQARIDSDWLWQTSVVVPSADGQVVRLLGAEAQLLHLCAHLALHHAGSEWRDRRVLWRHDIAAVLHQFATVIKWDVLLAKAAQYDLLLPLQAVLPAVVEEWDVPAPASVLDQLAQLAPSAEERRVYGRMSAPVRPVAERFYTDLAGLPGWRLRFRYGMSSLFPSPAYMRRRYNMPHGLLLPFYYPYRWVLGVRSALQ